MQKTQLLQSSHFIISYNIILLTKPHPRPMAEQNNADGVHRMIVKHLWFATTVKDLERELRAVGAHEGYQAAQIIKRGSYDPQKTSTAFIVYGSLTQVTNAISRVQQTLINGLCKFPCEADIAYPRSKSSSYSHLRPPVQLLPAACVNNGLQRCNRPKAPQQAQPHLPAPLHPPAPHLQPATTPFPMPLHPPLQPAHRPPPPFFQPQPPVQPPAAPELERKEKEEVDFDEYQQIPAEQWEVYRKMMENSDEENTFEDDEEKGGKEEMDEKEESEQEPEEEKKACMKVKEEMDYEESDSVSLVDVKIKEEPTKASKAPKVKKKEKQEKQKKKRKKRKRPPVPSPSSSSTSWWCRKKKRHKRPKASYSS